MSWIFVAPQGLRQETSAIVSSPLSWSTLLFVNPVQFYCTLGVGAQESQGLTPASTILVCESGGLLEWVPLEAEVYQAMALNFTPCYYHKFIGWDVEDSRADLAVNIAIAVANSVFSIVAVLGNAVVIFVIWKKATSVPYNTLLGCLALSDLVVGLLGQPSTAALATVWISRKSFRTFCSLKVVQSFGGWAAGGVTLCTLCAISLDRYLALRLHLRYAVVVTVPRVLVSYVFSWIFYLLFVTLRFFVSEQVWLISALLLIAFKILLILAFYAKVFQIIRRHRRQIHAQILLAEHFHGRSAVEAARHKNSAVTMMYVLAANMLCYVPFVALLIVEAMRGYTPSVEKAYFLSTTNVFLSSSLNPFFYCWRIREIRLAALKILRRAARPLFKRETWTNNVSIDASPWCISSLTNYIVLVVISSVRLQT